MEEKTSKVRTGTVNCMIAALIICLIAEAIGPLEFQVMGIDVRIMTMIWAIIIGILLSPHLLGKVIPALQKVISKPEIERSPFTFDGAVSIGNYVWYQCWSTDRRCI